MSFAERFTSKLEAAGVDTSDMPSQYIRIVTERPEGTYYADYDEFHAARGHSYNKKAPHRGRYCPHGSTFVTNTGDETTRTAVMRMAKRFRTPVVINMMPMSNCGQLNGSGIEIAALRPEDHRIVSTMFSLWYHGTTRQEKLDGVVPEELLTYSADRKCMLDNDKERPTATTPGICYRPDLFDRHGIDELARREKLETTDEIWTIDATEIGYRKVFEFMSQEFHIPRKMQIGDLPRFEETIDYEPEPYEFQKEFTPNPLLIEDSEGNLGFKNKISPALMRDAKLGMLVVDLGLMTA